MVTKPKKVADSPKKKIAEESQVDKTVIKSDIPSVDRKQVEALLARALKYQGGDVVTELFDTVMRYAHEVRASDVHMEPEDDSATLRIRVDGILHDDFKVTDALHRQMIAVLKILTRMRTDEHRAPQDGRYAFTSSLGDVDVRASIIPVTGGEKAVLRLLSSQSHKLSLEQLGFSDPDLERIKRAIHKPWGMILTTGPTGSGKTTTIYAILEILNTREVNIATIEDPVEFDIVGVNQSQVDSAAKLTFANGLRAILRQDPDIIGVGEIRDEETAKIAVNAALTGHKLLSTLHTNNSASTIPRLIDMQVEPCFDFFDSYLCRSSAPDAPGLRTLCEQENFK
jgi:type IV pilus assembly protein PilB